MSEETKERRCKICGKLLISEKKLLCRRCKLEGRNKAGQVGGIIASAATFIFSAKALVGDGQTDDTSSD